LRAAVSKLQDIVGGRIVLLNMRGRAETVDSLYSKITYDR